MMNFPKDPILLMSVINTYLRDQYPSFDTLCDDCQLDSNEVREKLASAGFVYLPELNQFR